MRICNTYDVPPAGSTLSFGILDSISKSAKSRGRSKGSSSKGTCAAAVLINCFHEFSTLADLDVRCTVEFEAQPKHVTSVLLSLVVDI